MSRRGSVRARSLVMVAVASLFASILGVAPGGAARPVVAATVEGTVTTRYVGPGTAGSSVIGCRVPDYTTGIAYAGGDGSDDEAIQAAVNATVVDGDVVFLCDHHYLLDTKINMSGSTTSAMTIRGESTAGSVVDGRDAVQLFAGTGQDLTFERLTLTNGMSGTDDGAAVAGRDVTIRYADVTSNSAPGTNAQGGAVFSSGVVTVEDSLFAGNSVNAENGVGGAIYASDSFTSSGSRYLGNSAKEGGAVDCDETAVSDSDLFRWNSSSDSGGALYAGSGGTITGSTFRDNTAGADGGAIYAGYDLISSHAIYIGNRATNNGGAISADYYNMTSTADDFSANTATYGGAIFGYGETSSVARSTFIGNRARGGIWPNGGAVFLAGEIVDSTFTGNRAEEAYGSGGAVYAAGSLWVRGSTFLGNTSTDTGSAIALASQVTNSTFIDNSAGVGPGAFGHGQGAIDTGGFAVELVNLTFVGNTGVDGAGAIYGTARVANTLFGSTSDGCSDQVVDHGGNIAVTATTTECIDSSQSASRTTDDPSKLALAALAEKNPPGDTPTVAIGDASIAIGYGRGTADGTDTGTLLCTDDAEAWSVGGVDQRGVSRTTGDPLNTDDCDSGAYENGPGAAPTKTTTKVTPSRATDVDPFYDTATVSGTSGDGKGGFKDPTGEVQFWLCYDVSAATNCDWTTDTEIWSREDLWVEFGDPVELSGGSGPTSATDGIATAKSDSTTGANLFGDGYYVFHASYSSGDPAVYLDSEDSGGTSEVVRVAPISVILAYTGPVIVYTTGDSALVTLTAQVSPNTHACPITFRAYSDGTIVGAPATVWTVANGIATSAPVRLPLGTYDIEVTTGGEVNPCAGAPDFTGVLSVVPSAIAAGKGGTGGGWYQSGVTPPKVSFGYTVQVTTTTSKVGRATVTTTRTRGQLIWVSKNGWRLKGIVDYSATDGSTAWAIRTDCDPTTASGPATRCATFSGSGILQKRADDGTWVASEYGRVGFVVRAYDGGTSSVCKGSGKAKSCMLVELADYFGIVMTPEKNVGSISAGVPMNAWGSYATGWSGLRQGAIRTY